MQKVLIVSTLEIAPWGGSEVLWSTLAGNLIDSAIDVSIDRISWPQMPAKVKELISKGALYYPRPNPHIYRPGMHLGFRLRNKLFNRDYARNLREAKPDFVVFSLGGTFEPLLLKYWPLVSALNIPYILVSQHTNEFIDVSLADRWKFREIFTRAKQVYFVAERNLEVAERTLATKLSNATLIYSPAVVDRALCGPYPKDPVARLAVPSRFDIKYKGQDLLLDVLRQDKWKQRAWHLSLYGDGPDQAYLEALVAYFGLEKKVTFKGFSNRVEDIWTDNQMLIMPSHSEGTPISLMQACFCGRAGIVTDVGGNAEIIADGVTGFVAAAPTVRCIDEALEAAFARQGDWEEMGKKAQERADKVIPPRDSGCILQYIKDALGR